MNIIQRQLFKLRDPIGYQNWKFYKKLSALQQPSITIPEKPDFHFKHSGNAGDIIYAIPSILAIAKEATIHLHLNVDQSIDYGKSTYHPLGDKMLNHTMVELLKPLLLSQPQFKTCDIYSDQLIDIDLDLFRQYPLHFEKGNIARWNFWIYGINYNLSRPWLYVEPDTSVKNAIVIARSHRYRTPGIDYSFLRDYPETVFVGLPNEYKSMQKMVPNIKYHPTNNFLELAQVIAGSKLFIGNQSFPFSLAEGLKTKRLLEVCYRAPNVIVYGENGYDFCFQAPFEKLVKQLYNE